MTDQEIDRLLNDISQFENGYRLLGASDFNNNRLLHQNYIDVIRIRMREELELITAPSNNRIVYLTEKGKSVINDGGWLEHLKKQKDQKTKKQKKERYDYQFSKFRYWTFWVVFSLGLFGGLYGIYDAFFNQKDQQELEQIKQDIQENKKQLKELHTLLLNQKKTDSLRNSKTPVDSVKTNYFFSFLISFVVTRI